MNKSVAPFGAWESPITIDALVEGRMRMEGLTAGDAPELEMRHRS